VTWETFRFDIYCLLRIVQLEFTTQSMLTRVAGGLFNGDEIEVNDERKCFRENSKASLRDLEPLSLHSHHGTAD
jgi:hypothetical protein